VPKDLVVRASVPTATLIPAVRAIVNRADPQQPVTDIKTLEAVVTLETAPHRMALGAQSRDILAMVMGRTAMLALAGVSIGAAAAYAAARSMQSLLAGVEPANVTVFAVAAGLSLIMALAGSVMPAWRAVRVDPLEATRAN
jgi:hypothetical protein